MLLMQHLRWAAVPPVGVEPTLGTLLGGRPLPLGYGGTEMIPRSHPVTLEKPIERTMFSGNVVNQIRCEVAH